MMHTVALFSEEMNQVCLHKTYLHVTVHSAMQAPDHNCMSESPPFSSFYYSIYVPQPCTLLPTPGDGALAFV